MNIISKLYASVALSLALGGCAHHKAEPPTQPLPPNPALLAVQTKCAALKDQFKAADLEIKQISAELYYYRNTVPAYAYNRYFNEAWAKALKPMKIQETIIKSLKKYSVEEFRYSGKIETCDGSKLSGRAFTSTHG